MKSTQTAETVDKDSVLAFLESIPESEKPAMRNILLLMSKREESESKGEQCIYCGKDSWTCEHFDPREEAERNQ